MAVLAAWMLTDWPAAAGPDPGEPNDPSAALAEPPATPAEAREALAAWERAVTADEKLTALETLARRARQQPLLLAPLASGTGTGEPRVRARLLEVLADAAAPDTVALARRAVVDPEPALAAVAAAVLGRLAPDGVRDDLISVWRQPATPAAATVEAVTAALSRAVSASELATLHDAETPAVRRAALDALRRQGARQCAAFLSDVEPSIADAAAAAIYDHRIEAAWEDLAEAGCSGENALTPAGRSRAVAAAWHAGGAPAAERLAAWLAATPAPADAAAEGAEVGRHALRALLDWSAPPDEDPLQRARRFHARPRPAAQAWPALRRQAAALAAWAERLGGPEAAAWKQWRAQLAQAPRSPKELALFLADPARPEGERLDHFRTALAAAGPLAELATAALNAPDAPLLRAEARAWIFRQRSLEAVPWLLQSLAGASPVEKQAAIRLLDQQRSAEAQDYLLRLLDQARFGLVDPAVVPEVVEAMERRARAEGPESRGLRAALDAWRSTQPPSLGDPLRPWRAALQPGDAEAGRAVFFSDTARCATCHRPAEPVGSALGSVETAPRLEGVARRLEGSALLEAVVLPADPASRRAGPPPSDGGCRPMGTVLTLRELRDLLTYLRTLP
jgi:hypothetical protein